ncbi:MAG: NAD(P)/FAD-dependent oxidoreductase [Dehalococcoidia bacterium]|nr:NAD(P)/FAD-dependent oxidoreductase [Dehalococcoidia bacterium]
MSERYDVAIIGGGPSGSYAAALLASGGHSVVVVEKKQDTGIIPCCTGVVGTAYAELVGLEPDVIISSAMSATFVSPFGRQFQVASPHPQALVLDRALLERRLLRRAAMAGADVHTGVVVVGIERNSAGFELRMAGDSRGKSIMSRSIVVAAGVNPGMTGRLELGAVQHYMVGAHAEIEMDGVSETEIYMLQQEARGLFAWLVPTGNHTVRAGVLSHRAAAGFLRRFLDRAAVRSRLRNGQIQVSQRPVPVAALGCTYADGLIVIGDAAGHVKPTTGGGLYFGAIAARAGVEVLSDALKRDDVSSARLSRFEREWKREFGSELQRGSRVRSLYGRLSPERVDAVIGWMAESDLVDRMIQSPSFSFDRHSGALMTGLMRGLMGQLVRPHSPAGGGAA